MSHGITYIWLYDSCFHAKLFALKVSSYFRPFFVWAPTKMGQITFASILKFFSDFADIIMLDDLELVRYG